jgi:hypothetical protein
MGTCISIQILKYSIGMELVKHSLSRLNWGLKSEGGIRISEDGNLNNLYQRQCDPVGFDPIC